jgi:surface polysaccharide O-acyltransferase-like enzyme
VRISNPEHGQQAPRYDAVEVVRVLAALAVVCFHYQMGPAEFRQVFYAGLVSFLIISVWFTLRHVNATPRQNARMLARLMIPWAVWSAIFLARDILVNGPPALDWRLAGKLFAGASIHLWYVPFIALVVVFVRRAGQQAPLVAVEAVAWVAIALLTAFAEFWRPWSLELPLPLPQYVHALFPVCAGVILFADCQRRRFVGTAVVACAALWLARLHGVGVPYLVGLSLCALAFAMGSRISLGGLPWLMALAETTFGVYLLHPLLFHPVRKLIGEPSGLTTPIVVFATATTVVLLVRRYGSDALRLVFGLRPRAS